MSDETKLTDAERVALCVCDCGHDIGDDHNSLGCYHADWAANRQCGCKLTDDQDLPTLVGARVERILAERTQALRDEVEQERERANSNFDQALAFGVEVEQLREEIDHPALGLRRWREIAAERLARAEHAEAQLAKLRQGIEALVADASEFHPVAKYLRALLGSES